MAGLNRPPIHLVGLLVAITGVADEYPCHHTSLLTTTRDADSKDSCRVRGDSVK